MILGTYLWLGGADKVSPSDKPPSLITESRCKNRILSSVSGLFLKIIYALAVFRSIFRKIEPLSGTKNYDMAATAFTSDSSGGFVGRIRHFGALFFLIMPFRAVTIIKN